MRCHFPLSSVLNWRSLDKKRSRFRQFCHVFPEFVLNLGRRPATYFIVAQFIEKGFYSCKKQKTASKSTCKCRHYFLLNNWSFTTGCRGGTRQAWWTNKTGTFSPSDGVRHDIPTRVTGLIMMIEKFRTIFATFSYPINSLAVSRRWLFKGETPMPIFLLIILLSVHQKRPNCERDRSIWVSVNCTNFVEFVQNGSHNRFTSVNGNVR